MKVSRTRKAVAAIVAVMLGSGLALVGVAAPANAATATVTFSTPGVHAFIVPVAITTIHVLAQGGSGGGNSDTTVAGAGALIGADLTVTPGDKYFVNVASNGVTATATFDGAGVNGGGGAPDLAGAGGGGGASDLRLGADTLASRVLVAAGGGGLDGWTDGADAGSNAPVNNPSSLCFDPAATAGTSVTFGIGGGGCDGTPGADGALGVGGDGGPRASGGDGGGGGGGGLYGGGGAGPYGGGAGGSSYEEPSASGVTSALGSVGAAPFVSVSYDVTDATTVTVTASKPSIAADGSSKTVVTADVTDAEGTGIPGETVTIDSTDTGQLFGPLIDNGDGTYSSVVTSSTTVHLTTITVTDISVQNDPDGTVNVNQTAILATTGVDPGPALWLAALLLLAGLALVSARRAIRFR
ncbi:MAG TPA: glycine-rich protein [Galbitalea sp.]|jgi:hypothetical protein|nr:glycine-rich protein [Galbitalea sp.]